MTGQKLERQTIAKVAVLFAISYIILFLSGKFFYAWDSPMYFLPPIAGFFFTYVLLDWIDKFFETDAAHQWHFPLLILLLAFVAEYITLFWYFGNIAQLNGSQLVISFGSSEQASTGAIMVNFVKEFKESAFLPFVLSCVLGWLSHIIIDQTQKAASKKQ